MSDDRELAGLCGRAWEARGDHEASVNACAAIVDWWDARHIRWTERLEQERARRRVDVLGEIDDLMHELDKRMNGHAP